MLHAMFKPRSVNIGSTQGAQTMYSRGYTLHTTEGNIDQLLKSTTNGNNITLDSLMNGADIIGMSSDASSGIDIDGGWDAPRHVVELVIESQSTGNLYILNGFTSTDFMINGGVNTHAMIRFNTYTEMALERDHLGNAVYTPIVTDNILAKTLLIGNHETPKTVMTRPRDILSQSNHTPMELGNDFENVLNIDQLTTGGSTARNSQSVAWLGRTLSAYVDSMDTMDFDSPQSFVGHSDPGKVANYASQSAVVAENDLATSPVIGTLLSNMHDYKAGEISWGMLINALPEIANMIRPPNAAGGGSQVALSEWNNRDVAAIISEYANAIPALLQSQSLRYLDHTVSNNGQGTGQFDVLGLGGSVSFMVNGTANSPGYLSSVPNPDITTILHRVEMAVKTMIFPKIAKGHNMTISCRCSTLTDMTITVNLNGYDFTFSAPTWASSMWSVNMVSSEASMYLASSMSRLASHVSEHRNSGGNSVGDATPNVSGPVSPLDELLK